MTKSKMILTDREQRVLRVLRQKRRPLTLAEMASMAFPSKGKVKGNSWCRNQLRRLRKAKLVKRVAPGTYMAKAAA